MATDDATDDATTSPTIERLVVVGMGDVTTRFLIPAVGQLAAAHALPDHFDLRLVSRHEVSAEELADDVERALVDHGLPREVIDRVIGAAAHHRADATDPDELGPVIEGDAAVAVYLALPPDVFPDAIDAIARIGLPHGSRLVFEKPFGDDLDSAVALNEQLRRCVPDDDVFRVDHFLGKQTVQQIVDTRFANRLFEAVWHHEHVESIEIVWDETLGLEGRAGFYDSAGALRDMVQSHLMQLFCLVAMERPSSLDHHDVADRKVDVLRSTRPFSDDLRACSTRARYTAGTVGDREIEAYTDSEGVDPDRGTETFASVTLAVDTDRWREVPFTVRSGKALAEDRHEVVVRFRPATPPGSTDDDAPPTNLLRFGVKPDRIELDLVMGEGADHLGTRAAALVETLGEADLDAYSVLLRDVITGGSARSVRADEVEESWRVVQPFLDAWAADDVPLEEYPAGSTGP
ncbi:MAG: glucose-6-phosphate dehydrogenase [Ilumatobacter sp.]|nr:MAG: glucose-6-phosphate dehydrogenase [Ilumatobacter sp.]